MRGLVPWPCIVDLESDFELHFEVGPYPVVNKAVQRFNEDYYSRGVCFRQIFWRTPQKLWLRVRNTKNGKKVGRHSDYRTLPGNF